MGGAVHEQEAQVAPAVAEARELALAAARVVLDRELGDPQVLLGGPDHHLRGELHAGRAQVQARQHVAAQRAHAAVGVADAGAEEEVEQAGEDRVADVAVQPRHRARLDVVHAVADHQLGALFELRDEARDLVEVVGQVGVGHHDVAAARGGEAGEVGAAVAAPALVHDARAGALGQRARESSSESLSATTTSPCMPIRAIASSAAATQRLDVLRLVEAGDHDRDERRAAPRAQAGESAGVVVCASVLIG